MTRSGSLVLVLVWVGLVLLAASPSNGATYNLTPSTSGWQNILNTLQPGDVANLAAGTYVLSSYFELNLAGTSSASITVRGAGAGQTIIQQNSGQNVVNMRGQYYGVYNMSFTGGSRGIRMLSGSYATFDGVNIYNTQGTAFSANDAGQVYANLVLRRMEVYNTGTDTGECFYLGCNNDGCQVRDSIVELNYCHDTAASQAGYGSGIQLKTGSYRNIIRDNVMYNTGAPGILIYDDYQRGANLVEGNVVVGTEDHGIQLSSGAIIRNNIVVGAAYSGIYVANNQNQQSGVYHNIQIVHNTVYNSGNSDLYLPALSGSQFVFANNAFLSANAFNVRTQSSTVWLRNAYVGGSLPPGVPSSGIFQVGVGAVTSAANNNFYPSSGSALINAGSTAYASPATKDFNNTPRSGSTPTVGAYEYTTATNPGWTIARGFKRFPSSSTLPSASRTPAAASPSRSPAAASPSRSPAQSPSRTPAPASPSRSPAASPTRSPAPASPSRSPTASPTRSPAPASPSRSPAASPTRSPAPASPSRSPAASVTSTPQASTGRTFNLTPASSWVSTLSSLQAGDTANLAAGTYVLNGYFALALSGTASSRITIRGAGAGQTIIQQNAAQNVMNVQGQYFGFYNMSFTGGSRGVRIGPQVTSYATFDGVNIYGTQSTALSANDNGIEYSNLVLRRMEIYNTGTDTSECFYLGCNSDGCRVRDSLIENNYCHDTTAALSGYGSGIQLKTGSYRNVIRDNVMVNTGAPGILIYDDYARGANLVQGNVIIGTNDNGIQVGSGVVLRNNIVVNAYYYGIFVSANQLQTSGVYHDITIEHNTVYGSGSVDLYLPALTGSQFVFANNAFLSSTSAFYAGTQTSTVWLKNAYVAGSRPSGVTTTGAFQVTASAVINAANRNFYPSSGSPLINAGSKAYTSPAPKDFNGTPRSATTPTVGAYEYTTTTNPGPAIGPFFKTISSQ